MTIYEILRDTQIEMLRLIEEKWGRVKLKPCPDPEDDYEFRFFDKLMREKPRR